MLKDQFISGVVHIDNKDFDIKYYRYTNFNGLTTYSTEIEIGKNDKIILDDNSIYNLKNKLRLVIPAAIFTRINLIEE